MSDPLKTGHERLVALLRSRSILLGDFILSSGRRSTYYIDCRKTTMHAEGLDLIGRLGLAALRERGWVADAIGGLTLGADPVAYAVALASCSAPPIVNAFTVRTAAKTHGAGRLIEGCFEPGAQVVVAEDVITSGGSALRAAQAVRDGGGTVLGVLAVVDRGEGGREALERFDLPVHSLVLVADLLEGPA